MQNAETARGKPTIAEDVYHRIREDILAGKLFPGMTLRSDWMRKQYSVGISPLREALTRLSTERLIVAESQRGFRVAPIDAAEVLDVLDTRIMVETKALRQSIELGSVEWEGRVLSAYHIMSRNHIPAAGSTGTEQWVASHRNFHMELLSASRSVWLLHLARLLFDQSERYRALRTAQAEAENLARDVGLEHKRILDAALARDADLACEALVEHYTRTADAILMKLEWQSKQAR
ncbi:GntR family transcriptional regulator [Agrobacterium tumefaciens]|uniref:GntR family transcriptional regulator n=1 Tax=Agrobacterium tumefaciens TaxID=358 RepID=UPI0021FA4CB8|nr:GntR family transcriptional regulator [Agrobacterium tumefaciens]UXT00363.1 GntR family transcriptional regulator [Agrobacterium tumefaciens]